MIREIVKDIGVLSQKSERFVLGEDDYLIADMLDTAHSHKDNCLGIACIQIGVPKRVILVRFSDKFVPFINPVILNKSPKTFLATEGCLSLDGERSVRRHREIKLIYTDSKGKRQSRSFNGLAAQIIQHECDHLDGKLI